MLFVADNFHCKYSGLLLLMHVRRFERYKVNVCGVAPVVVPGIENVDLSHIVTQVHSYISCE